MRGRLSDDRLKMTDDHQRGEDIKSWFLRVAAAGEQRVRGIAGEEYAAWEAKEAARKADIEATQQRQLQRNLIAGSQNAEALDEKRANQMLELNKVKMAYNPGPFWWPEWLEQQQQTWPELTTDKVPRDLGIYALTLGIEETQEKIRKKHHVANRADMVIATALAVQTRRRYRWGSMEEARAHPHLVMASEVDPHLDMLPIGNNEPSRIREPGED